MPPAGAPNRNCAPCQTVTTIPRPTSKSLFISFDDLDGAVRAPAVHDDVFKVGIALAEDGVDAFLEELALVEGRSDEGYGGVSAGDQDFRSRLGVSDLIVVRETC